MILRLRSFLFSAPAMPLWCYVLLSFPIALIPSLVLSQSVQWILIFFGVDVASISPSGTIATPGAAFGSIVFAPIAETFILAYMLTVLSSSSLRRIWVVVMAAICWGCFHAISGRLWFFGTVWSFFVFSCAYLVWRQVSFRKAFLAAALPHVLINSLMMMLLLRN
ncbi:hypothetical protein GN109_02585 [Collimonas pratensis]|uniref:hypothetical protein n=1 Tax=Collimonas pratensis TaxID=279113 RepID=UPI00143DC2A3|nr:hypothetical protein [Collimonas pratensis]NKI68296.1 hypothetical protein [Collimonas pratensis]